MIAYLKMIYLPNNFRNTVRNEVTLSFSSKAKYLVVITEVKLDRQRQGKSKEKLKF